MTPNRRKGSGVRRRGEAWGRERRADAGYQETVPAQPASQVTARQTFGNKTIKALLPGAGVA
jgi:hypothetical protein